VAKAERSVLMLNAKYILECELSNVLEVAMECTLQWIGMDIYIYIWRDELSMHILMSRLFWLAYCWSPPFEN